MSEIPRQAIVLAAGLGTRLQPLTFRVPKPALPVGGVPILYYNLALLRDAGVRKVVINLHHLPRVIEDLIRRQRPPGLQISFSLEPKILGTAGGIAKALSRMDSAPTFVLNGDILCDADLAAVSRMHRRTRAVATLVVLPKDRAKVESFVEADRGGRIWRIAGGPPDVEAPSRVKKFIFSGIHLVDPALFAGYPRRTFGCVVRQIYQPALERGLRLQSYRHRGEWWDLGSLGELKGADHLLWKGRGGRKIQTLRRAAVRLFDGP